MNQFQSDVVVTFDAELPRLPYAHPDHQAIGRTVMTVVPTSASPAIALVGMIDRIPVSPRHEWFTARMPPGLP